MAAKSDAECQLEILKLTNEKGKFGLGLDYTFPTPQDQLSFEFLMEHDMFRLIDVSVATESGSAQLLRIFKLTDAGHSLKAFLESMEKSGTIGSKGA